MRELHHWQIYCYQAALSIAHNVILTSKASSRNSNKDSSKVIGLIVNSLRLVLLTPVTGNDYYKQTNNALNYCKNSINKGEYVRIIDYSLDILTNLLTMQYNSTNGHFDETNISSAFILQLLVPIIFELKTIVNDTQTSIIVSSWVNMMNQLLSYVQNANLFINQCIKGKRQSLWEQRKNVYDSLIELVKSAKQWSEVKLEWNVWKYFKSICLILTAFDIELHLTSPVLRAETVEYDVDGLNSFINCGNVLLEIGDVVTSDVISKLTMQCFELVRNRFIQNKYALQSSLSDTNNGAISVINDTVREYDTTTFTLNVIEADCRTSSFIHYCFSTFSTFFELLTKESMKQNAITNSTNILKIFGSFIMKLDVGFDLKTKFEHDNEVFIDTVFMVIRFIQFADSIQLITNNDAAIQNLILSIFSLI